MKLASDVGKTLNDQSLKNACHGRQARPQHRGLLLVMKKPLRIEGS